MRSRIGYEIEKLNELAAGAGVAFAYVCLPAASARHLLLRAPLDDPMQARVVAAFTKAQALAIEVRTLKGGFLSPASSQPLDAPQGAEAGR